MPPQRKKFVTARGRAPGSRSHHTERGSGACYVWGFEQREVQPHPTTAPNFHLKIALQENGTEPGL